MAAAFSIATGVVFLIIGVGLIVMLTVGGVLRTRAAPDPAAPTTPAAV